MSEKGNAIAPKRLAIIGGGPRGLSALESVYRALARKGALEFLYTVLFESSEHQGAGKVYNFEQPDTNWVNVSERGLTIPAREEIKFKKLSIPSYPSYQDWAGYDKNRDSGIVPDKFPVRSTLGKYLYQRYHSIASVLEQKGLLKVSKAEVVNMDWKDGHFEIIDEGGTIHRSDELVLTIGHQPTKNSEQISSWLNYSSGNTYVNLITEPYPVENTLKLDILNASNVVALRGFGLAMIDVMRALTTGLGGKFEISNESTQKMSYLKSGNEPKSIIPFSLDGLPMSPKPLNLEIDQWFFPTEIEKDGFDAAVTAVAERGDAKNSKFLIEAIAPIVSRVFTDLDNKAVTHTLNETELQDTICSWLTDDDFKHNLIVPKKNYAEDILNDFVGMATATKAVSLDFCIGHVWRHCQPTLYKAISFSNLQDEVIASIIGLDERLKRYSYGPPVASLQQLIALVEAGIVDLDFVNDPDIETTEKGWLLSKGENTVLVNLMVNSVLDAPELLKVNSPIVDHLLHKSMVQPVYGELGAETLKNGCVLLPKERDMIPLAVLGRLAKGTLLGVDAILECFGIRSEFWAEGVVARILK